MADWETTLQRSLIDRAGALGSYIRSLQTRSARSDDGFAMALDMCHRYTEMVQLEIDRSMAAQRDAEGRRHKVGSLAREFFDKERWIDQRFARGAQSDVPRALKSMARREFKRHGLHNQEPVLTVGAPDNFETHKPDLAHFLFDNFLYITDYREQLPELPKETKLSIISVPYIEGTRTLWYPITLGHEIGHMRIANEDDKLLARLTENWFDEQRAAEIEASGIWILRLDDADQQAADSDDPFGFDDGARQWLGPVRPIQDTLASWVEEILCDLNAVRLFGPAGLNAIAEFLSALPATHNPKTRWTTHPPLRIRLQVMFEFLKRTHQTVSSGLTEPWHSYLATDARNLPPDEEFVANCFDVEDNLERLIAYALTWGDTYFANKRRTQIDWVTQQLLDGVPGGTHCLDSPDEKDTILVADTANAAWSARHALEEASKQTHWGVVFEADPDVLSMPRKRLIVDRLASKAIDSIEFARLWRSTAGDVQDVRTLKPIAQPKDAKRQAKEPSKQTKDSPGGVLSRLAIIRRLQSSDRATQMVVTPLLTDSIQDAGVDLRLGPDFIVFRHSATGAFNALDKSQDPRMLQEAVEKGWGVPFILHPGELVLAATFEYIVVPEDVAAQVVTRSSYGRLGLITATAVQVQPGSRGCITLELVNHGDTPIALMPGARIGQLVFTTLNEPSRASQGKYGFAVGPEFSRVAEDKDAEALELVTHASATFDRIQRYGSESMLVRMRFEGRFGTRHGALFEEIVEREGMATEISRPKTDGTTGAEAEPKAIPPLQELVDQANRGVGMGELHVSGDGTVLDFARATVRFVLAYRERLDMTIDQEGTVNVFPMRGEKECDIYISLPHYDENGNQTDEDAEEKLVNVTDLASHEKVYRGLLHLLAMRRPGRRPDDRPPEPS